MPSDVLVVLERLSAMVVGRQWLHGVSCALDVKSVVMCLDYFSFKQLEDSVLASLPAVRETIPPG